MKMSNRIARSTRSLLSSVLVLGLAAGLASATPAKTVGTRARRVAAADSLAAQAKVGEAAARATALAKVPGGRVKAHELERENGLLIHSFDIVVPGHPGIEEVNVNAMDGSIVSAQHEGKAAERLEAKQDRAEKATAQAARKTTKAKAAAPAPAKAR
jgi:hypothetical protein